MRKDLITSLVLLALGAYVIFEAARMPRFSNLGVNPYTVPGIVPAVLGAVWSEDRFRARLASSASSDLSGRLVLLVPDAAGELRKYGIKDPSSDKSIRDRVDDILDKGGRGWAIIDEMPVVLNA